MSHPKDFLQVLSTSVNTAVDLSLFLFYLHIFLFDINSSWNCGVWQFFIIFIGG